MIRQTTKTDFHAAMTRIKDATGATTQVQLAEILGVRQPSISDAKRRGSIPADWLLKLLCLFGLWPDWVLTGQGPKYPGLNEEKFRKALEEIVFEDSYESETGGGALGNYGQIAQAVLDEADKAEPIVEYPLAADPNKVEEYTISDKEILFLRLNNLSVRVTALERLLPLGTEKVLPVCARPLDHGVQKRFYHDNPDTKEKEAENGK